MVAYTRKLPCNLSAITLAAGPCQFPFILSANMLCAQRFACSGNVLLLHRYGSFPIQGRHKLFVVLGLCPSRRHRHEKRHRCCLSIGSINPSGNQERSSIGITSDQQTASLDSNGLGHQLQSSGFDASAPSCVLGTRSYASQLAGMIGYALLSTVLGVAFMQGKSLAADAARHNVHTCSSCAMANVVPRIQKQQVHAIQHQEALAPLASLTGQLLSPRHWSPHITPVAGAYNLPNVMHYRMLQVWCSVF